MNQEKRIKKLEKQMMNIARVLKIQSTILEGMGKKMAEDSESIENITEAVNEIHELLVPKKMKKGETPRYIG